MSDAPLSRQRLQEILDRIEVKLTAPTEPSTLRDAVAQLAAAVDKLADQVRQLREQQGR